MKKKDKVVFYNFIFFSLSFFGLLSSILLLSGFMFEIFAVTFVLLGIIQIYFVRTRKIKRPLGKYLSWMGYASVGVLVSFLLHNFLYAATGLEEGIFFVLGVIVFPLVFLAGFLGSLVVLLKLNK